MITTLRGRSDYRVLFIRLGSFITMLTLLLPAASAIAGQAEEIPSMTEIRLIRKLGEYVQASEYLDALLADSDTPDEIRMQAYNELVTITILTDGQDSAKPIALEALNEFPTLEADHAHHPEEVFDLYEELRKTMFGQLDLLTDPPGGDVFLDDKKIGITPMENVYVPPGKHTIRFRRYEYKEETLDIYIAAGQVSTYNIALKASRSYKRLGFGFEVGLSNVSLRYGTSTTGFDFVGVGRVTDYSSLARLNFGIILNAKQYDKFSFQLGLRYAPQGNRATYDMYDTDHPSGKYECNLKYLTLPILFKYYPKMHPRFFMCAGPEFGFLMSAELVQVEGNETIDINSDLPSIEVFMTLGLGFEIGLTKHVSTLVSGYYSLGMLSLRNQLRYDTVDFKPQEFRVAVGMLFQ